MSIALAIAAGALALAWARHELIVRRRNRTAVKHHLRSISFNPTKEY